MPAPRRKTLVDQLRELMKHTGASTEARAASFPALRQLRVVKQLQLHAPQNTQPIRQVLYSAARSLQGVHGSLAIPNSDIALAALGLGRWDGRGIGLLRRLGELGEEHGFTALSTMRRYLEPIAELLAKTLRKLTVDDLVPVDETMDAGQVNELDAHVHWVYRGQILQRQYARRTLRAGTESLESYNAYLTYPNDSRANIVSIRPFRNCSEGQMKRQRTGQFELAVMVPRTGPGQVVSFEYEILVASEAADRPYLRHLTRMPAGKATVSIQFDTDCMPSHVNPFEKAGPDFEPAGGITSTAIAVRADGYVEHEFTQVLNTRYGFGWSWPGEES